MTSCPEAMVLRIWKFWKTRLLEVDCEPCCQTVGLSAVEADSWSWISIVVWRSLGPTVVLRNWGPTMMLRNWDWTTRCTERWDVVSILWLRKTFKNCLFPRVEEPKSEVNKWIRTWTTESPVYLSPPVFACVFAYIYVLLSLIDYGYVNITALEEYCSNKISTYIGLNEMTQLRLFTLHLS